MLLQKCPDMNKMVWNWDLSGRDDVVDCILLYWLLLYCVVIANKLIKYRELVHFTSRNGKNIQEAKEK